VNTFRERDPTVLDPFEALLDGMLLTSEIPQRKFFAKFRKIDGQIRPLNRSYSGGRNSSGSTNSTKEPDNGYRHD
jgi:hypothetical protein